MRILFFWYELYGGVGRFVNVLMCERALGEDLSLTWLSQSPRLFGVVAW
jgi:hypothetical protein